MSPTKSVLLILIVLLGVFSASCGDSGVVIFENKKIIVQANDVDRVSGILEAGDRLEVTIKSDLPVGYRVWDNNGNKVLYREDNLLNSYKFDYIAAHQGGYDISIVNYTASSATVIVNAVNYSAN